MVDYFIVRGRDKSGNDLLGSEDVKDYCRVKAMALGYENVRLHLPAGPGMDAAINRIDVGYGAVVSRADGERLMAALTRQTPHLSFTLDATRHQTRWAFTATALRDWTERPSRSLRWTSRTTMAHAGCRARPKNA